MPCWNGWRATPIFDVGSEPPIGRSPLALLNVGGASNGAVHGTERVTVKTTKAFWWMRIDKVIGIEWKSP